MQSINRAEHTTFLIVTHEPDLAAQASQVLHMEDGLIKSSRLPAGSPTTDAEPSP